MNNKKYKIIALSGWGMPRQVWDEISDGLRTIADVDCVEWRGIEHADQFKDRVRTRLNTAADQRMAVMGWSLGSVIALDVLCDVDVDIDKLILISTTAKFTRDVKMGYTFGWRPEVLKTMKKRLEINKDAVVNAFYDNVFTNSEMRCGGRDKLNRIMSRAGHRVNNEELTAGLDYLLQVDLTRHMRRIHVDTLLIHGENDSVCKLDGMSYIVENIGSNAEVCVVAGCGHAPIITNADLCIESIGRFLGGVHKLEE